MKIFLIAGEPSGDLLGSKLIKEIKSRNEKVEFVGVGGKLMQAEGLASIFDMHELSIMGFAEVLPRLCRLIKLINQTAQKIISEKPDCVITIDSPDFNFRVMKKLKDFHGAKKVHLIAPSVWAYREGRAEKISKLYDLLLAILPFEPPYFTKYGLKTVFIGHPITENAPDFSVKEKENSDFRKARAINEDDILLCLTPGSRISEITRIFPHFISAINFLSRKIPNIKVVIPVLDKTKNLTQKMSEKFCVKYFLVDEKEKKSAFFASNFALAKSGTNTLEISMYKLPMVIAYRINLISFVIAKILIKIKFANLINLILNKEVIPEMLQYKCEAQKISDILEKLITDKNLAKTQIEESGKALNLLKGAADSNPTKTAVDEILKLISNLKFGV